MSDIASTTTTQELGDRQHAYMLGAGLAWFSGAHPDAWSDLADKPASEAIPAMVARMSDGG